MLGLGVGLWMCVYSCSPPQKSQPISVSCQRVRRLKNCCASFSQRVHIFVLSDVFFGLSALVGWGFCFEVRELEKVGLCCGYDWGCGVGHKSCVVPFYNQRVCHSFYHRHRRKVIFLICPQAFGFCSKSENGSESLVVMMKSVLDDGVGAFGAA